MITCVNHKDKEADFYCSQCKQCFCNDCVRIKQFGRTDIKVCPVCNDSLRAITVEREDPPFKSDLLDILRFPFHGYGLLALLVWPIITVIIRGVPYLIFFDFEDSIAFVNPFFYFIYYTLVVAVFMQLVNGAGNGYFEFPTVRIRGNFSEISKESSARLYSPFIAVFWPVMITSFIFWLIFRPSPSMRDQIILWSFFAFFFVYCAFAFFLLPMVLLMISMDTVIFRVFNPFYVLSNIKKILKDYLIFLLGAASFLGIYILVRQFALGRLFSKSALFYIAYFLIDGAIHIYSAMIIGLLLGNMSYRRRYELKWLPHTYERPEFIIEEKPPMEAVAIVEAKIEENLDQKMSNATCFLYQENYEYAAALFKEILDEYPENIEALRGSVKAAFGLDDHITMAKNGRKIASQLASQGAYEAMWDIYKEYHEIVENFVFDMSEMLGMAQWLDERRMHLEEARVLRELAVSNLDTEQAASALYKCAQLLWNKCDKPENAVNVLNVLIDNYPESEFIEMARQLLGQINTPND